MTWLEENVAVIKGALVERFGETITFPEECVTPEGKFAFSYNYQDIVRKEVTLICHEKETMITLINRTAALFELVTVVSAIRKHFTGFHLFADLKMRSVVHLEYHLGDQTFMKEGELNPCFTTDEKGEFMFDGEKLYHQIQRIFDSIRRDLENNQKLDDAVLELLALERQSSLPLERHRSHAVLPSHIGERVPLPVRSFTAGEEFVPPPMPKLLRDVIDNSPSTPR